MTTEQGVPGLLRRWAEAQPAHVALVVDGGDSLTYREWDQRSDAVAAALIARGVGRGDRVALAFDNARWTSYAVCCLGVQKAGAAAVPLSPRFSQREAAAVIEHAAPKLVVDPAMGALADADRLVRPAELEPGAGGQPPSTHELEEDDLAEIIYTSGTTGAPKGVACTHGSLLIHDLPPGGPQERVAFAHAFPIGTNAGQECLRMPLRRLATAVVLPVFDPERLCALIASHGIQRLQLVPAMAQMLVASGAAERHDVSSVEAVTLSSAPPPPTLLAQLAEVFPGASLWNAYALTEGGGARTLMRYEPQRPGAVGRPVGATELLVVDDDGRDTPPGTVGEVWLRRPGAPARTYFRDPEATAAAFENGWLKTGDLGYLDEDGHLHLVDRKKDLIISGGFNLSSVEIEHALDAHPAVAEAGVFGVPHPVLGQEVAAAVVASDDVEVRELQAFVREHLGEHKVPRTIWFVDALPRTDTGKIRKRELRERFADAGAVAEAPTPPRSETEAAVLAVWQAVLGRDDVGVHDDFFDLGGHSLAATQVVARLADTFDVELAMDAVFERPTAAELAATLDDIVAGASP